MIWNMRRHLCHFYYYLKKDMSLIIRSTFTAATVIHAAMKLVVHIINAAKFWQPLTESKKNIAKPTVFA